MKEILKDFLKKYFPEIYLKIIFKRATGQSLNLKNPQTFNEKIQWLKLYDYPQNNLIIECADKYRMHDYLKRKGLEKYSVNILGGWDKLEDVNWNKLPTKFVLKMTHGSSFNIFIENKNEVITSEIAEKINKWGNTDYGKLSLEYHYSKMKPRIIAEEFLNLSDDNLEFQFFCFNGVIKFCRAIRFNNKITKELKGTCYDSNWLELPITKKETMLPKPVERPNNLEEMLDVCSKIALDFKFVRIDFIKLKDGNIKLNELTFSPTSGMAIIYTPEAQQTIGNWLSLNIK